MLGDNQFNCYDLIIAEDQIKSKEFTLTRDRIVKPHKNKYITI